MTTKTLVAFPQLRSADNVEYVLRDKNGNIKPIFQENAFCKALLKSGWLSPLWINSPVAALIAPFFGHWATSKTIGNLITNAGFALAAGLLNGSGSPAAATYIAVGTGTTAAAVTDTALQTESSTSGLSRASATVSLVTTSVTNDTAQMTKTFSVTGTVAVTESGVLNASSTGTLLSHQVFSSINVVNGDSLAITWKVQMH
jgi:hypothetical protein